MVFGIKRRTEGTSASTVERQPDQLRCTYCGGTEFLEGPSGGMSTNVLCANKACRHWFNWTGDPIFRLDDLNRVEPTEEQRKSEADAQALAAEQAFCDRKAEGAAAYAAFAPIGPCAGASTNRYIAEPIDSYSTALRRSKAYGGYSEAYTNIDRLVGYIEAMHRHVIDLQEEVNALKQGRSDAHLPQDRR